MQMYCCKILCLFRREEQVEAVSRVSYKHAHKKQSKHMGWGVRLVSFISSLPLLKRIVKKVPS